MEKPVPAVLTFRPDNMLTIGLMFAVAYTAAVLGVQALDRWGLLKLGTAPAVASDGRQVVAA